VKIQKSGQVISLEQTAEYAKKCDATESHIVVFDRDEKSDWREKVFT